MGKKGPTAISLEVIERVFQEHSPFSSRKELYDTLYDACPFEMAESGARSTYLKKAKLALEEWERVQAWNRMVRDGD